MSAKFEDLIAEVEAKKVSGARSWYDSIEGDEKAFVDLLIERAKASGTPPSPKAIARILKREFGDPVSSTTVGRTIQKALEQ